MQILRAATIPIAIDEAWREGWLKKGDEIALIGFGAGLTWGGPHTSNGNYPNTRNN